MNQSNIKCLFLALLLSQTALAKAPETTRQTNSIDTHVYDKETIKQALLILLESQALTLQPSAGAKLNHDLLDELRKEGILQTTPIKEAVICVDPMP
jgi:hypothetical protein